MPSLNSGGGSPIKSIQRGQATPSSYGRTDVAIAAVELSKSVILVSHSAQTVSTTISNHMASARLTSSTNLRIQKIGTNGLYFNWEVIEYV